MSSRVEGRALGSLSRTAIGSLYLFPNEFTAARNDSGGF
jgi:hypothetical protein